MNMLDKHYSGHLYRNSPYETDYDCGNCDGARCNSCQIYWTVDGNGNERFYDKDKAQEVADKLLTLIPDVKFSTFPSNNYFFEKDGELYVTLCGIMRMVNPSGSYCDVKCNSDSLVYQEKLAECIKRSEQYKECTCHDKDDENIEMSCPKYGCNDSSCYHEMKNGKREEKKWYM